MVHPSSCEAHAYDVAVSLLKGEMSTDEMVRLLSAMHERGESVDELVGFISAMRDHMVPVSLDVPDLVDICGTGGSHANRFNVSTAVALILGCLGISVAKHGNRGSKKANGSVDFLDALGIPYALSNEAHQATLHAYGSTFLFARSYHPALRHAVDARKQLTTRSIFNMTGPFCNPASPVHQVIGTPSKALAERLVLVGQRLSYRTFSVITSDIGLDECATVGISTMYSVRDGHVHEQRIDPRAYGIHHTMEDIQGGDANQNASRFMAWLHDRCATHPIMVMVALNAAVVMHALDATVSIDDGMARVIGVITDGTVHDSIKRRQSNQP